MMLNHVHFTNVLISFIVFSLINKPCKANPTAVDAARAFHRPVAMAACQDCNNFQHFDTSYLHNIQKRIPYIEDYPIKEESCLSLFRHMSSNTDPIAWPPPNLEYISAHNKSYYDDLILGGKATVKDWYVGEKYNGAPVALHWTSKKFNKLINTKSTCGNYYVDSCELVMMGYSSAFVEGKVGMVIGSEFPWAEALAFRFGAKQVYTQEYREIKTEFPNHFALTPSEVTSQYMAKQLPLFDFIFSYSSLEHSGLGRYGDKLEAFGDILAIAQARCQLKTGGVLFLGFPTGYDQVVYNVHRVYGFYRLHLILSLGFEVVDVYGVDGKPFSIHHHHPGRTFFQPMIVLKKIE